MFSSVNAGGYLGLAPIMKDIMDGSDTFKSYPAAVSVILSGAPAVFFLYTCLLPLQRSWMSLVDMRIAETHVLLRRGTCWLACGVAFV